MEKINNPSPQTDMECIGDCVKLCEECPIHNPRILPPDKRGEEWGKMIKNLLIDLRAYSQCCQSGTEEEKNAYAEVVARSEIELENYLHVALTQDRERVVEAVNRAIDENISISQSTHRIGQHSDDWGGSSDELCECDRKEKDHQISALESLKKKLSVVLNHK